MKKILIAEDERAMAKALELKLTHSGYEVMVVGDGEAAVEALKAQKFDLLILDIMMPKMNGFQVLEFIQKNGIKVAVFVASNLSMSKDVGKVKELGALDYFIKADTPLSEIVEKIRKILGE